MKCLAAVLLGALVLSAQIAPSGPKALFNLTLPSRISASAVDSQGNLFLTGFVSNDVIPITPNAFQRTFARTSCPDLFGGLCPHSFVAKVSADGARLIYATYLGGSGTDMARTIAVDSSGNAVVAGTTTSTDFPVTVGAYRTSPESAFVSRLSADGSALLASTHLAAAEPADVALDDAGNAYLTGTIRESGFVTTPGAFQTSGFAGAPDAFVLKLDASLRTLVYSTLLGGSFSEVSWSIAVDPQRNAYVTGTTQSTTGTSGSPGFTPFPVTPGAFVRQSSYNAIFITKLNPEGSGLVYSSVFGSSGNDVGEAIAVDASGNAYIGGSTGGLNIVSENGTSSPASGGFVAKLSAGGSRLLYLAHTGGGGSVHDSRYGVAVNAAGNLFVTGFTYGDVRTTPDSLHPCYPENRSAQYDFVQELKADGTGVLYSTLFDRIYAVDNFGGVWVSTEKPDKLLDKIDITEPLPPQITCVASAAALMSGPVAPGELVAIFGSGIGPDQPQTLQFDTNGRVHFYLGELSVYFNGVAAPLLYVSRNQINAVVPYEISGWQDTSVVILKNHVLLPETRIPATPAAPTIFTMAEGCFPAVLNQDGSINSPTNPATLGSIISIYATGAGLMQPLPADGDLGAAATRILLPVRASVHRPSWHGPPPVSAPLDILYAGDAPTLVQGMVQINARLPDSFPLVGVNLVLTVGDTSSPAVCLSVR